MGYIEGEDRNQTTLFPESIEEYITEVVIRRRCKANSREGVPFGIILVSETAIPKDVEQYLPKMKGVLTKEEIKAIEARHITFFTPRSNKDKNHRRS